MNTAATPGGNTTAPARVSCCEAGGADSAALAAPAAGLVLAGRPLTERGLSLGERGCSLAERGCSLGERGLSPGARGRGTPAPDLRGEWAPAASAFGLEDSRLAAPAAARVGGTLADPGGNDAGLDGLALALSAALREEGGGGSERIRRLLSHTGVKKPDR